MHSYPDWFVFHHTIWHGFMQIGNSVPPLLAREVGRQIVDALGVHPVRPRTTLPMEHRALSTMTMRQAARLFGVDAHVVPPRLREGAKHRCERKG